jgi:hypothetical protein
MIGTHSDLRHKSHLLFVWLDKLVRRSAIVDAVEDLYGSDLLCWTTNFFIMRRREHLAASLFPSRNRLSSLGRIGLVCQKIVDESRIP